MSNQKVAVTQAEVRRYLKALHEAGYRGGRIEIERLDGTRVSIIAGMAPDAADTGDDIDRMIAKLP